MPLSNEDFQALKNRISTCIKATHVSNTMQFFADFELLHTEAPAAALTLWQTKPSNILKFGLCSLRTRAAYLQLLGKLVVTSHVPYAVVFWNNLPHHLEQLALQAVFSSENTEVIAYMQFFDQHLNDMKPLYEQESKKLIAHQQRLAKQDKLLSRRLSHLLRSYPTGLHCERMNVSRHASSQSFRIT